MSAPLGLPRRRPSIPPAGPHPTDREVVGTYVHSYDSPRRHQRPIPGMRPAQAPSGGVSPTPIYDALYAEYRRSFRALPGDRSGEEDLAFSAFNAGLFASRSPLSTPVAPSGPAGPQGPRASGGIGSWQRVGRHAGRPRPAALPPGPQGS